MNNQEGWQPIRVGDTVCCIDAQPKAEWAKWYQDDAYCDLIKGERYLVRAIHQRDGQIGFDVGVPTPWGDPYWSAERFERSLLRIASKAPATLVTAEEQGR